jgi:hypothetical protein
MDYSTKARIGLPVMRQSFYPQFPGEIHADDYFDPKIDEHRVKSKWQGDSMDIQQSLQCMFELEKSIVHFFSTIDTVIDD